LFGNAEAIKEVAASKSALWWALALVFITAIPRNYDQTFILEKPFLWVFGPVVFSTLSSLFIFCFIFLFLIRAKRPPDELKPRFWPQYRSFLGLYWMTAPVAWLYALPVERFLAAEAAARVNVLLLAIVSLWRVWLLSRALSVALNDRASVVLAHVLTPVCLEVSALIFFGGRVAKMVMSGMSGMRNSPAEDILISALGFTFVGSLMLLVVSAFCMVIMRPMEPVDSLPELRSSKTSWRFPVLAALGWLAVAAVPQLELWHNYQARRLLEAGDYRGVVRFLSTHSKTEFAPARRIDPDPYEETVWKHLPQILAAMDGHEAAWVLEEYLSHADVLMRHKAYFLPAAYYPPLLKALEARPEWPAWSKRNRTGLEGLINAGLHERPSPAEEKAKAELETILERVGIPEPQKPQ
jgi:hypothetical protein